MQNNPLRAIFSPPHFDNSEDNRRASLLNVILITSGILTALYIPVMSFTNENPIPGILFLSGILAVFVVVYIIFKQGNLNSAALSLSIIIWVVTAYACFLFGGVISPSYISLYLIVYAAGLIVSSAAANIFAVLTVVLGIVLVIMENYQLLPTPLTETTPASFLSGFAINVILLAIFTRLTNNNIISSFSESRANQEELEKTNTALKELQNSLENTINQRTEELQRKNTVLEAIASVVKNATQYKDPQLLIENVVNLISKELSFYHVGVYLIDRDNQYAVLKASSSIGGKAMISRNHQLQVGKQGIVGYVTGIGQHRVAQDVSFDRYHASTTELPETRSQLALPLKAHGGIIGALDIHENKDNAFSQDDIEILQTLADQVALAIDNADLYQETQKSLEDIRKAYGEYNQQAWLQSVRKNILPSYRYTASSKDAAPIDTGDLPELDVPGKQEIPIIVRGQLIGSIDVVKDEGQVWTEEEQALLNTLSDQIGTALDSARLFDETQERAVTERLIADITTRIRESLDLHAILQNTAVTIRESLELPQVTIRLAEATQDVLESPSTPELSSNGSTNGSGNESSGLEE